MTVVDIPAVTVIGTGGGSSVVLINGYLLAKVIDLYGDRLPQVWSETTRPVFEYRIVKDLGLSTEEVVYPASGTETRQTITALGYTVGGTPSTSILLAAGTYTFTLQARWNFVFYTEGSAYYETTNDGGTDYITKIKGVGTQWGDWLPSQIIGTYYETIQGHMRLPFEFRIPSDDFNGWNWLGQSNSGWIDFAGYAQVWGQNFTPDSYFRADPTNPDTGIDWFSYRTDPYDAAIPIGSGTHVTSAPGAAYEIRFSQSVYPALRNSKPIIDVSEAALQVTEKRA